MIAALYLCAFLLSSIRAEVPVYVMLPLDVVNSDTRSVNDIDNLRSQLTTLRDTAGIHGFMMDIWWGLVERDGPNSYYWQPYIELVGLANKLGLKVRSIMSFHQCGGNVGDTCDIPLPSWVTALGDKVFYTDQHGHADHEYLSSGVDHERIFGNRTGLEMYRDYMQSFHDNVLTSDVVTVEIGLGPAGELRYPSYQLDRWSFCGVGEFQCYDPYLAADLKNAATAAGHPEWGNAGPNDAGDYNSRPSDTPFFNGGYSSDYGRFFLNWYSSRLIQHGSDVLSEAKSVFGNSVEVCAKIAGIHWWYDHPSHAAELTAGYYNTNSQDGYGLIASMLSDHHTTFDFTCLEMRNNEQDSSCQSNPETLVAQTKSAALGRGIGYDGENALPRYDETAYNQIIKQATAGGRIGGFTYLRLTSDLLQGDNLNKFSNFVHSMSHL